MQRHLNTSFWLAAVAYAIAAAGIFFATSTAVPTFTNMDDCLPIPIRVVMCVRPFGWLTLVLTGGVLTLCASDSWWRVVSVILVCLLALGIICTIMFTSIEHPTHIKRGASWRQGRVCVCILCSTLIAWPCLDRKSV